MRINTMLVYIWDLRLPWQARRCSPSPGRTPPSGSGSHRSLAHPFLHPCHGVLRLSLLSPSVWKLSWVLKLGGLGHSEIKMPSIRLQPPDLRNQSVINNYTWPTLIALLSSSSMVLETTLLLLSGLGCLGSSLGSLPPLDTGVKGDPEVPNTGK